MKTIPIQLRIIFLFVLSLNLIYSCKKDDSPTTLQPTSIELSEYTVSLVVGGREKLLVSFEPADADLSQAKWVSSDTNIVKVDNSGIVTAIAAGSATVTFSTANNLSKQCSFTVVQSPVSGIVLPMANYPIGNGLKFIIQGTGFSESNKIWFRKASYSNAGFKSAQDGDDILGEIHEIAENYINVSGGATNGWYSVYLEDDGNMFNLGNLEFSTYQVPAFVIDPTINYWEDTHWRMMQLRGHVKEMRFSTTHQIDEKYLDWHSVTSFNNLGYKTKEIGENDMYPIPDKIEMIYDNQNRIINYNGTYDYLNPGSEHYWEWSYLFTYGSHNKFFPIEMGLGRLASSYWAHNESHFCAPFDNDVILEKGLTGIKYTTSSNYSENYEIDIYADSIVQIRNSISPYGNYSLRNTFIYNGVFPSSQREYRENDPYPLVVSAYTFSSIGMPVEEKFTFPFFSSARPVKYVENCPISIYSVASGGATCEYDDNLNLIRTIYIDGSESRDFYYTSYDEHGNWTQCIAIAKWTGNYNSTSIWTINRDFTYWE